MPGITSTLPSNGISGGALHSGPASSQLSQYFFWKIMLNVLLGHLGHSLATHRPLEQGNNLLCFRSPTRPGWFDISIHGSHIDVEFRKFKLENLTGDFKGGLMIVLLKGHPLLTNKTHTLAKWNRIAKPDFEDFGFGDYLFCLSLAPTIPCASGW